jgi:hypothetical protein
VGRREVKLKVGLIEACLEVAGGRQQEVG